MPGTYSEALVLRVNELYHDFSAERYADIDNEMRITEGKRWRNVAERFFRLNRSLKVLDIGTGNGFLPTNIGDIFKENDLFICSDISSNMLREARRAVGKRRSRCRFSFIKINGVPPLRLPFSNGSLDIVLINSVLHHVKNTSEFLGEVDRILKPGGMLAIGHEPNRRFRLERFLRHNSRALYFLMNPKSGANQLALNLGIHQAMLDFYYLMAPRKRQAMRTMITTMNKTLQREGLIDRPLTPADLPSITDVLDTEGFEPDEIAPEYQRLHMEFYDFLGVVNHTHPHNKLVQRYDRLLARRFPGRGRTFFAVLMKP